MSTLKHPVYLSSCDHLTVFSAKGADARSFLQSQLTQDVTKVTSEQAAIAGFCTAQGRLWATMLLAGDEQPSDMLGIVRLDLIESFLKRLKMFILRSKVAVEHQPSTKVVGIELHGDDVAAFAEIWGKPLANAPWASSTAAPGLLIQVPSAQPNTLRYLAVIPQEQLKPLEQLLGHGLVIRSNINTWQVLDIQSGMPWVEAATQDLFIAQTLNLDLIGGVSFTKGCYPGQEVVARAHYRGTVKRRMHLARVDGHHSPITAATDVYTIGEPDSPIGRVINVASHNDETWVLFEAPFKSLDSSLFLASADAAALIIEPLPYDLGEK